MPTFLELQDTIAREARFASGATFSGVQTEIKDAINRAIRFYESELFWFNEQQATAITAADQEYYPFPSDFVQMHTLARKRTDTEWDPLYPISFEEAEDINNSGRKGEPDYFCTYNLQIRLVPIPNAVYTLRLSYLKRYADLVADTDTSEWTTLAEPMIRAKAKALLFLDALHDPENAAVHNNVAEGWFTRFQTRTRQQVGTGQVRPYLF